VGDNLRIPQDRNIFKSPKTIVFGLSLGENASS